MDIRMRVNNIGRSVSAKITNFAAPRKGDHPEQLSAEYDALAARLRELKQKL